jgi:hypothetical protein
MTTSRPPGPWVERWLSEPRYQTYLDVAAGDRRSSEIVSCHGRSSTGTAGHPCRRPHRPRVSRTSRSRQGSRPDIRATWAVRAMS